MTFVDIGAGTGFFSRAASDIVGKQGTVYALDMSADMLEILKRNGIRDNIHTLLSEEYRLPLEDNVGDLTLISIVLHENADVNRFLAEAARVTKSSGKILIIEWKKQDEESGPAKAERLGLDDLLPQLSPYDIVEQGDVTRSHYYVVVRKKKL